MTVKDQFGVDRKHLIYTTNHGKVVVRYLDANNDVKTKKYTKDELSVAISGTSSNLTTFNVIDSSDGKRPLLEPWKTLLDNDKNRMLAIYDYANAISGLGDNAFSNCKKLSVAILPTVINCSTHQFNDCTELLSINLDAVKSFNTGSFSGDKKLLDVNINTDTFQTIPDGFDLEKRRVGIQYGSIEGKLSGWSTKFCLANFKTLSSDLINSIASWSLQGSDVTYLIVKNLSSCQAGIFASGSIQRIHVDNGKLKSQVNPYDGLENIVASANGKTLYAVTRDCTQLSSDEYTYIQQGFDFEGTLSSFKIHNDSFHSHLNDMIVTDALSTRVVFCYDWTQSGADFINSCPTLTALDGYICRRENKSIKDKRIDGINLSNIVKIGTQAFYGMTVLTAISVDNATDVASSTFSKCTRLSSIGMANWTNINSNVFSWADGLAHQLDLKIKANKVISIGSSAFNQNKNLVEAEFMSAEYIGSRAFYIDEYLSCVIAPNLTKIDTEAFYNCSKLQTLVLSNAVKPPQLIGNTVFSFNNSYKRDFPISVYIPTGSRSTYEAQTNWAYSLTKHEIELIEV